jgi:hypothetical protein
MVLGRRHLRWSMGGLPGTVAAMPRQDAKTEPSLLSTARRARIESLKAAGERGASVAATSTAREDAHAPSSMEGTKERQ